VLFARSIYDIVSGQYFYFAKKKLEANSLESFQQLLATYSAPIINPSYHKHLFENKIHNLKLAANMLNNLIIKPGEIFSFWYLIKAPTYKRGFKEASTFINNRITSTVGGALCQLSGVIYNVALLSNMKIIERHAHSIDAYGDKRYIPLGRDATVVYGYKDLRFKNTQRKPVILNVQVNRKEVTAWLYGSDSDFHKVFIEVFPESFKKRTELVIEDTSLPVGEKRIEFEGCDGYKVKVYRIVYSKNGKIYKEYICEDNYKKVPKIIRVGTLKKKE
jgi:vancomycin resistance protein VanW